MKPLLYILSCGILCIILKDVYCWRNYAVTLRSAELLYENKEICEVHQIFVKKLNRSYSVATFNGTTPFKIDVLYLHIVMYEYRSNRYFPHLLNHTVNICEALENINKIPFASVAANFVHNSGNFPKKCPVLPGTYYFKNLHVDEEQLPPFFLPYGRWKFEMTIINQDKVPLGTGVVVMDVTLVIPRKQKKP